jgi:hypothetical protein
MAFLVEDLLEEVKARSFAPISQTTFQDADLLRILNSELKLKLVADLIKIREDFFLWRSSTPLIANKSLYPLPTKAIGDSVKAVFIVDSAGQERPISRKDIDHLGDYSQATGDPQYFYFEGDRIGLFPTPSSGGSILFSFPRRLNELTLTSTCAKITAVSTLAGVTTFTVDTDLTASLITGALVDFLKGTSPYLLHAEGVAITAITLNSIEVATAGVDDVDGSVLPAIGDYICPAGYSNIPMIPEEFQIVLAQMGAVRLLASLGDMNKWQSAKGELNELRAEALKLVKNRAESAPEKVTRKNPLLRTFRGR